MNGEGKKNESLIFVGQGDVWQAFDSAHPFFACQSLLESGAPEHIVHAIISEMRNVEIQPVFLGEQTSKVTYDAAIPQGGTESPNLWNYIMRKVFVQLLPGWHARNLGIKITATRLLSHLVWADNLYLFCDTYEGLQTMFRELTLALFEHNLSWKKGSLQWMSNYVGELGDFEVDDNLTVTREKQMPVLGTIMFEDGASLPALKHRLLKAQQRFWQLKKVWGNSGVSAARKAQIFQSDIVPIALFGSPAWSCHDALLRTMLHFQDQCLHIMFPTRKFANEEWPDYYRRRRLKARKIYGGNGGEMLVVTYFRSLHRWIVKAQGQHDMFQLLRHTMHWKDSVSWLWTQAANAGHHSQESWRHGRRGQRVTKWDTWLVKMYGPTWIELVDSMEWKSAENLFVLTAIKQWGVMKPWRLFQHANWKSMHKLLHGGVIITAKHFPKTTHQGKRKRVIFEESSGVEADTRSPLFWAPAMCPGGVPQLKLYCDNSALADAVNAVSTPASFGRRVGQLQEMLGAIWQLGRAQPFFAGGLWATHIYREYNTAADKMANTAMDSGVDVLQIVTPTNFDFNTVTAIRVFSDGGLRSLNTAEQKAGAGWQIEASCEPNVWFPVHIGCARLYRASSAYETELVAMECALYGVFVLVGLSVKAQQLMPRVHKLYSKFDFI
jgi:hypothetical protein